MPPTPLETTLEILDLVLVVLVVVALVRVVVLRALGKTGFALAPPETAWRHFSSSVCSACAGDVLCTYG